MNPSYFESLAYQIAVDVRDGGVRVHHVCAAVLRDAEADVVVVGDDGRELDGDGRGEHGPRDQEPGVEHLAVGETADGSAKYNGYPRLRDMPPSPRDESPNLDKTL